MSNEKLIKDVVLATKYVQTVSQKYGTELPAGLRHLISEYQSEYRKNESIGDIPPIPDLIETVATKPPYRIRTGKVPTKSVKMIAVKKMRHVDTTFSKARFRTAVLDIERMKRYAKKALESAQMQADALLNLHRANEMFVAALNQLVDPEYDDSLKTDNFGSEEELDEEFDDQESNVDD